MLGLVFGFAILGSEIGHALAHRVSSPQGAISPSTIMRLGHLSILTTMTADTHAADAHAHFDLRSAPSTKPSLTFVAAVWTVV